jgi:hypothetical protein
MWPGHGSLPIRQQKPKHRSFYHCSVLQLAIQPIKLICYFPINMLSTYPGNAIHKVALGWLTESSFYRVLSKCCTVSEPALRGNSSLACISSLHSPRNMILYKPFKFATKSKVPNSCCWEVHIDLSPKLWFRLKREFFLTSSPVSILQCGGSSKSSGFLLSISN